MRLMVIRLSPLALAKPRVLQSVSPRGVLSKVRITTRSTSASLTLRGPQVGARRRVLPDELAHHLPTMPSEVRIFRDGFVIESLGAGQQHARAPRQGRLAARPMGERLASIAFVVNQNQSGHAAPDESPSAISQ